MNDYQQTLLNLLAPYERLDADFPTPPVHDNGDCDGLAQQETRVSRYLTARANFFGDYCESSGAGTRNPDTRFMIPWSSGKILEDAAHFESGAFQ